MPTTGQPAASVPEEPAENTDASPSLQEVKEEVVEQLGRSVVGQNGRDGGNGVAKEAEMAARKKADAEGQDAPEDTVKEEEKTKTTTKKTKAWTPPSSKDSPADGVEAAAAEVAPEEPVTEAAAEPEAAPEPEAETAPEPEVEAAAEPEAEPEPAGPVGPQPREIPVEDLFNGVVNVLGDGLGTAIGAGKVTASVMTSGARTGIKGVVSGVTSGGRVIASGVKSGAGAVASGTGAMGRLVSSVFGKKDVELDEAPE